MLHLPSNNNERGELVIFSGDHDVSQYIYDTEIQDHLFQFHR